jgi:uncharacterized protein (TIGR03437 family)
MERMKTERRRIFCSDRSEHVGHCHGRFLSANRRSWNSGDFTNQDLPTKLDGVGVTTNGEPAFVSYISPIQINFLVPLDLDPGPVEIRTANNGLVSAPTSATLANAAPGFFFLKRRRIRTLSRPFKRIIPRR